MVHVFNGCSPNTGLSKAVCSQILAPSETRDGALWVSETYMLLQAWLLKLLHWEYVRFLPLAFPNVKTMIKTNKQKRHFVP